MDKQEYKATIEQMKAYMADAKYEDAVELAAGVNWRKVHNVNSLVDAADAYEATGRISEAKELLKLAHDRSPVGRTIIYKLAMLCLKQNDIDDARRYLEKFVEIAPKDSHKYILKYHILKAGNATDESLIKVLEQLKEADFMEEWGYELACLYRKNGLIDECVSTCDDLILWFGEGPYVESALEMKMIYTPLDKEQEDKYRHFKQKKDGITEILANEELASGEIISHTVTIPSIELPQETFNTVNLQAEIKKNIDEIMKATEAGEVNENMDAIMSLVEEIPYLRAGVPEEEEPEAVSEKPSINEVFKDYLKEEYSGQMSLLIPEDDEDVLEDTKSESSDVAGQMTIEEVLSEWEKTRHAAELALEDAKKAELEQVKAKALREANFVLNRLEEVIPKLDAGVSPTELLKEEYLSSSGNVVTKVELPKEESFSIPVLDADGAVSGGISIPVVHMSSESGKVVLSSDGEAKPIKKAENLSNTTSWEPPTLDINVTKNVAENEETTNKTVEDVTTEEASVLLADVNLILQAEIDKATGKAPSSHVMTEEERLDALIAKETVESEIASAPTGLTAQLDVDEIARIMGETQQNKVEEIVAKTLEETSKQEPENETVPEVVPEDADKTEESVEVEKTVELQEAVVEEISTEAEPVEAVDKDEEIEEAPISVERLDVSLTADDRKIFTYFMQIRGMDKNIERVLTGTVSSILSNAISRTGNIIITGDKGTGKTKLATSFVKSIQRHTGSIAGPIGKIDGDKLNNKDLTDLFSKINGGTLIIENASGMHRETAAGVSLIMSQKTEPTLVILEDTDEGIINLLRLEPSFNTKFTEKITIPVFTIDELVEFGKTYAADRECVIEEMAVLALYNRINLIGRYDHPTSISEVAEIMEEAIDKANTGGIFKKKAKLDKDGRRIIREKDFEE